MTRDPNARALRVVSRLYRLGLFVLPRAFRRQHAEGLAAFFDESARAALGDGGTRALARRLAASLADLVTTSWQERVPARLTPPAARALPRELRAAVRGLARAPAFTVGAFAALVLGAGIGTALVAVLHAAVLAPLPVHDESRLVHVGTRTPRDTATLPASYPDYRDWRDAGVMPALAAYAPSNQTVTGAGDASRLPVTLVTASFFETLGVPLADGRGFQAAEESAGADAVVILSHAFRQRHFPDGSPVVGRTLRIGGRTHTIVGVLPERFRFDLEPGDLYVPLGLRDLDLRRRDSRWLGVIGRLHDGQSPAAARTALSSITAATPRETPLDVDVQPLRHAVIGPVARFLWLLGGATLVVGLAAAASLATLVLARMAARQRELAVRSALGASATARLLALSVELLCLGAAAAVAAAVAGHWTARLAIAFVPASLVPHPAYLQVTTSPAQYGGAALLLTALGALPAIALALRHENRCDAMERLRGGRTTTGEAFGLRRVLVAVQVALATTLVVGTGLMSRSLDRLLAIDPGFETAGLLTLGVSLPAERYRSAGEMTRFYRDLDDRLATAPGVERVGLIDAMPFTRDDGLVEVTADGSPARLAAVIRSASPGYFHALGIAARPGRTFADTDTSDRPGVAVIDESLARRLFPVDNPVGRRLRLVRSTGTFEIVGVVPEVRMGELDRDTLPAFYTCSLQDPSRSSTVVMRTSAAVDVVAQAVRSAVRAIDPEVAVHGVRSVDEARDATRGVSGRRLVFYPLLTFGGLAALIAAVGLYALTSYAVARRGREFAIRLALGASPAGLRAVVLRQALVPVLIGVSIGLGIAVMAASLYRRLLFAVAPFDVVTLVATAAGLTALATIAAIGPARRAGQVDPAVPMRAE